MARVRVRMNSAGARALLNSGGAVSLVGSKAEAVASAANAQVRSPDGLRTPPFSSDSRSGRTRAHAIAYTSSIHGIYHNNKHDTLLRSLGAGR